MKIIASIPIQDVQRHELNLKASVTIGSYGMDLVSPLDEFNSYRIMLTKADCDRLFLLNCGFVEYTHGRTGKVRDIDRDRLSSDSSARVNSFFGPPSQSEKTQIDLRSSPHLAIVLVCADAACGPIVITDGNHRAIAQYLIYGGLSDIHAYMCVHPKINRWPYVPALGH